MHFYFLLNANSRVDSQWFCVDIFVLRNDLIRWAQYKRRKIATNTMNTPNMPKFDM